MGPGRLSGLKGTDIRSAVESRLVTVTCPLKHHSSLPCQGPTISQGRSYPPRQGKIVTDQTKTMSSSGREISLVWLVSQEIPCSRPTISRKRTRRSRQKSVSASNILKGCGKHWRSRPMMLGLFKDLGYNEKESDWI